MTEMETILIFILMGYLIGSFPSGLVYTRLAGMEDIRNLGSGNIGATNVLRTGNKKIALATLITDMLKGITAILIAKSFLSDTQATFIGVAAFLGHIYPVWLNFKGGKGVATYIGVIAGLSIWAVTGFALIWLIMAGLFRYSSLAALTASLAVPIIFYLQPDSQNIALISLVMTFIVFFKHLENIQRLWKGVETKIGNT
ncbi:MAG: acyl-phosphate glycerol 3-phosphate acyltransferase [Rhizobiales bacterium TMED249]|nr:MAG: acyl-phosphate glycerol 3-phosphate acyltransferase [Rhizobiales bacterium TMED249]|tara:strand:- start:1721 stop:2317 length:597 start_codon:yes stop_codon:yes gene_type:complete